MDEFDFKERCAETGNAGMTKPGKEVTTGKLTGKIQTRFRSEPQPRQSGRRTGKTKPSKRSCRYACIALYQAGIRRIKLAFAAQAWR